MSTPLHSVAPAVMDGLKDPVVYVGFKDDDDDDDCGLGEFVSQ